MPLVQAGKLHQGEFFQLEGMGHRTYVITDEIFYYDGYHSVDVFTGYQFSVNLYLYVQKIEATSELLVLSVPFLKI